MSISIVAGLGNPGRDYADTRHNYGWIVLDAFAHRLGLPWREQTRFDAQVARWDPVPDRTVWLVKPLTFMNESGRSLGAFSRFHKTEPAQVAVIYDDLTIDLGLLKVSQRGSAGGHNGVTSVIEHLGQGFVRYRLGIGPKTPPQMDLKDFVLGKFTPDQLAIVNSILETTLDGLDLLLNRGVAHAMNHLNRRTTS